MNDSQIQDLHAYVDDLRQKIASQRGRLLVVTTRRKTFEKRIRSLEAELHDAEAALRAADSQTRMLGPLLIVPPRARSLGDVLARYAAEGAPALVLPPGLRPPGCGGSSDLVPHAARTPADEFARLDQQFAARELADIPSDQASAVQRAFPIGSTVEIPQGSGPLPGCDTNHYRVEGYGDLDCLRLSSAGRPIGYWAASRFRAPAVVSRIASGLRRDTSGLLDTGRAARFLGCAISTLNQWAREHRGPRFLLSGTKRFYALADLQSFKELKTC